MNDSEEPLSYASPQRALRPPTWNVVLSVLVGAFLIVMGLFTGAGAILASFMVLGDVEWTPILLFVGMLPFSAIFLIVGVLVMMRTVAALRGTPSRGARWLGGND